MVGGHEKDEVMVVVMARRRRSRAVVMSGARLGLRTAVDGFG